MTEPVSLNLIEIANVVQRIAYKERYHLDLGVVGGGLISLRARFWRRDTESGEEGWGHGRPYLLTEPITADQVVTTAFAAFLAIEEHEAREQFTVDGVRILGPHFDLERMVAARRAPHGS